MNSTTAAINLQWARAGMRRAIDRGEGTPVLLVWAAKVSYYYNLLPRTEGDK